MGLLRKAIGSIGLYASQQKSKGEYSGPCQMCGANGIDLYAYEKKLHTVRLTDDDSTMCR